MTDKARIERGMYWDRAWSLVEGCTPVSAGCENCWSARQTHMRAQQQNQKIQIRYTGLTEESGRFNGNIRLITENLDLPLITRKPTVWAIWNDLFHEDVPAVFIKKAWDIMAKCRQHTFLVLTKRPERMLAFTQWMAGKDDISIAEWPRNVWLGVTAENQQTADERIPILLQIPAAVRFVSVEPMLGPVDLSLSDGVDLSMSVGTGLKPGKSYLINSLDWVICGGETGSRARPMHPDWVRSLRDQCVNAGVSFFFKQWGEWAPIPTKDVPVIGCQDGGKFHYGPNPGVGLAMYRVGRKKASRLLDGREWNEMPEN